MKRKILIIINIILLLIMLKLTFSMVINNILISNYKDGEYSEEYAKMLNYLNFPESYIAYYNYGNILYQNGEYDSAIEEYSKALNGNVPKYKECNIRINNALSICKTVQVDEKNQDSIKNAIEKYESALDVLTEKGCANKENNNGHSQKAEQLKKDIKKEIDRLKRIKKDEKSEEDKEDEQKETNTKDDSGTIEEQIQNIKEEAINDQREIESTYKYFNKDFNTKEKNW